VIAVDGPSAGRGLLPSKLLEPHPARLAPSTEGYLETVAAHRAAVAAGSPGYTDPATGLFVLTASYLWDRGACCEQGCRHCPYLPRPGGQG
jgi:hypothetical protein